MPRGIRPHLPGHAFHVTTRLQDRAHLFTPGVRDHIVRTLAARIPRSDLRLLAFAIMTNHMHLVVVQGESPLGRTMQPLLTAVALNVQAVHGRAGHVFERRYRETLCRDAAHLRNAIAYTHANPVRAGLCANPEGYRWSSHWLYVRAGRPLRGTTVPVDVEGGLKAFSCGSNDPLAEYFRALQGALRSPFDDDEAAIPVADAGATDTAVAENPRKGAADIGRVAAAILEREGLCVEKLRSRFGARARYEVRARIAVEGSRRGVSGREIARFLRVSESAVSKMLRRKAGRGD